jgi:hypothetical protein
MVLFPFLSWLNFGPLIMPPPPRPAPYVCGAAVATSTPGILSWRSCPDRPHR